MKVEIFEKALKEEMKVWEEGKQTEYYKKYNSYPEEIREKAEKVRSKLGCPSADLLRVYREAKEYKTDKLILDGFWSHQVEPLLKTLETGKVKEFYFLDGSTALMEEIHGIWKGGWRLEPVEIEHPYLISDFATGKKEVKKALRFYKK